MMLTDVEREHIFLLGLGRPPEVRYHPAEGVTPRLQRVLDALDQAGLRASAAVNGELALRYPYLLRRLRARSSELVAHGWNMDSVHHGGLAPEREAELIARTLEALAPWSDAPIRGWLSPARSQSQLTPELLRQAGIGWFGDWVNDELPYPFQTPHGALTALPLSLELEDRFIVGENLHAESEYADQVIDACEFLLEEAQRTGHGRLLALSIHPWVMGQPHRIGHLERVFAHLASRSALVWNAAPSDIVAAAY